MSMSMFAVPLVRRCATAAARGSSRRSAVSYLSSRTTSCALRSPLSSDIRHFAVRRSTALRTDAPPSASRSFVTSSWVCQSSDAKDSKLTIEEKQARARKKLAPLNQLVDVELLEQQTPKEIKKIWVEYHRDKDVVCSVVDGDTFKKLFDAERGSTSTMFVLPLPRKVGFETILVQVQENRWLFTTLEDFKTNKSASTPCLTVNFYDDLRETKDLVLMRGTMNMEVLDGQEAQMLVNQWQVYLLNDAKFELVRDFNHNPGKFNFQEVVDDILGGGVDASIENEVKAQVGLLEKKAEQTEGVSEEKREEKVER
eukprot:TRINITY_DN1819_c0_g1_i2.p1 TRINITY_DN1819_c0_g1~~TRINITY_DN1819_c0_g1_i2.p1  ORF type:complete len:312 (-),score=82.36 TRINITY_DN1819_c0_g1_i2:413-1348(-)